MLLAADLEVLLAPERLAVRVEFEEFFRNNRNPVTGILAPTAIAGAFNQLLMILVTSAARFPPDSPQWKGSKIAVDMLNHVIDNPTLWTEDIFITVLATLRLKSDHTGRIPVIDAPETPRHGNGKPN